MAMYPGFEVQIKAPSKRKVEFRGLDYKYMRSYILKRDDENGTNKNAAAAASMREPR